MNYSALFSQVKNELEEYIKREINVDKSVVPREFEEETDIILNAVTYREKSRLADILWKSQMLIMYMIILWKLERLK